MNQETEMDWQHASATDRIAPTKALHDILKELAKHTGTHLDVLVEQAQEQPVSSTPDPHNNFRKGKIAWERAAKIHEWLARNHFAFAQKREPGLFQFPRQSDWDAFVEAHAIVGRLRIVHLKQTLGLIERDDDQRPVDQTLRLTQRFCFEVETELRGVALGFQRYNGKWHSVPLGADQRNPKARIAVSPQLVPHKSDGSPIGLRESNDAGDHLFAVLVAQDRNLPTDMPSLAKLDSERCRFELHTIAVRIVA
ncbi:hypothetical protein [Aestuariivita sp.]|jgi:hypothetical protein|uniref:hypothetical protein n=1 Tax=Aestuariivita sp. TaxID=1872407 RepID=UPI00216FC27E|nr:hypothetical protein [Aestuariivita sp.]MCE8006626.1 hypothetical protein [Aestuariivita sp.]